MYGLFHAYFLLMAIASLKTLGGKFAATKWDIGSSLSKYGIYNSAKQLVISVRNNKTTK